MEKSKLDKTLTADIAKELLDYDPETGLLQWKERDIKWFQSDGIRPSEWRMKAWNSRHANKILVKNKGGYICLNILGETYPAHRIAWLIHYGKFPKENIDHVNHIRDDNRIINLRDVSFGENARNLSLSKRNTSGYSGVWKRKNKWETSIYKDGKRKWLGENACFGKIIKIRKEALKENGYHENHGR